MFSSQHTQLQQETHQLNNLVQNINIAWDDTISNITSPLFKKLAHHVRPTVSIHPANHFYSFFLDSQIEQTQYTHKFWEELVSDDYLLINSKEKEKYLEFFQQQIINSSELISEMFNFYMEQNKIFFFSNLDTESIAQTQNFIKTKFLQFLKEGYIHLSNERHHIIDEEGDKYLYTEKRFFPSFSQADKLFFYIDERFKNEVFNTLSFEQQGLVSQIFHNTFHNEVFFQHTLFFFVNLFSEESSINTINFLVSFPIEQVSEMNRLYFTDSSLSDIKFEQIQHKFNQIQNTYNLRVFYNLMTISEDENKVIPYYSTQDTLNHISSLHKHLKIMNDFSPLNTEINKQVILGSHIPLSLEPVSPTASFSHVFNHKIINCHFFKYNKEETEIIIHEYQHFLDNLFLNHITNTSKTDAKFLLASSFFPIEFQNIFTKSSPAFYTNTLSDYMGNDLLKNAYNKYFENFIFSITSKFNVDESIIEKNINNIDFVQSISNLIAEPIANIILNNYLEQLKNTKFSDDYFSSLQDAIIHRVMQSSQKKKIYEYLVQSIYYNILPICASKYTPSSLSDILISYSNEEGFNTYCQKLQERSILEKELFLIPFSNPNYDDYILTSLFAELNNLHFSISNKICSFDDKFIDLFTHKNINLHHDVVSIMNYEFFNKDLCKSAFKKSCDDIALFFSSISSELQSLIFESDINLEVISVTSNSNFEKIYVPVPNIFNEAINKTFNMNSVQHGIYLNQPSEILARSISMLFSLNKSIYSPLYSVLKGKDIIFNSIDKSEKNHTLTLADFNKNSYNHMLNNHFVFLEKLNASFSYEPQDNEVTIVTKFQEDNSKKVNKKGKKF